MFLIFVTLWLRLANLGYSDYQGDEIKALLRPADGQSVSEFLLDQRKGPVQFLITYTLGFIDPTFLNQFLFRLPFALAGIISVYLFYKLLKYHFNDKVALYGSLFFSLNGILVAFSRIVQYQTVTIMFYLLALYFFTLALKVKAWSVKGLYLGMIAWAVSILAHFDGGFIAPFAFYIFFRWFKEVDLPKKEKITHFIFSGLLAGAILGLAIPLAFCMASSVSVAEIVIWGVLAVFVQILVFRLSDLLLRDLSSRIESGEMAAAVLLAGIKLSVAAVNAAAISG